MNTFHTVRRWETLTSIARRYGTNVNELRTLNHISDPRRLAVGTALKIPAFRPFDTPAPGVARLSNRPECHANGTHRSLEEIALLEEPTLNRMEKLWHGVSDTVLHQIREQESAEVVHEKSKVALKKRPKEAEQIRQEKADPRKASQARIHRDDVLRALRERLEEVHPLVLINKGVQLTNNERKKIAAAIGLCEVSSQVFSSQNSDQEFVGRRFGRKGIETSYSRIVHIGLSYGYIQFTQDSGSLGKLLKRMRDSDRAAFDDVFRRVGSKDNSMGLPPPNIELLIRMTTEGLRPDEISAPYEPIVDSQGSGQRYWGRIRKTKGGIELSRLANQDEDKDGNPDLPRGKEIRGPRVHPIPYRVGDLPEDIWLGNWAIALGELGKIPKFQDIQLQQAVDDYLNKILPYCRRTNIRTAKVLAFIGACRVRGTKESLFSEIGHGLGYSIPFERNTKELQLLKEIADCYKPSQKSPVVLGGVKFDLDEARRASLLLKNEFNFLDEDYYDIESYV